MITRIVNRLRCWRTSLGVLWICGIALSASAEQAATPILSPESGYWAPTNITASCATSGAELRYTTDGSVPTVSSAQYSSPVSVSGDALLRFRAFKDGLDPSETAEGRYAPERIPPGCQLLRSITNVNASGLFRVTIELIPDPDVDAVGFEEPIPDSLLPSSITGSGVWLLGRRVIRWPISADARTVSYELTLPDRTPVRLEGTSGSVDGESPLQLASLLLVPAAQLVAPPAQQPGTVSAPIFDPDGGAFAPTNVVISCSTTNAVIRYTTDGSLPTESSAQYSDALAVTAGSQLRARAFKSGLFPSTVRSAWYSTPEEISGLSMQAVTTGLTNGVELSATPDAGTSCWGVEAFLPHGMQPAAISHDGVYDADDGVVRWGTFLDDTARVLTFDAQGQSGRYNLPIWLSVNGVGLWSTNTVLVAMVSDRQIEPPPAAPLTVASPILSPVSSSILPVDVSVSCETAGAVLHYTVDGSTPTEADPVYTDAFTFSSPVTLRVRAFKPDSFASAVSVGRYEENAPYDGRRYIRTITQNGTYLPLVSLEVYPGSGAVCQGVAEMLPEGLTPFNISDNGVWLPSRREVRWGSLRNGELQTVSYEVSGTAGRHTLAGRASADGYGFGSTGDDVVQIDLTQRPVVAVPFFSQPPGTPIPVTISISCVTPGAVIRYTLDGTEPTEKSPVYSAPLGLITGRMLSARAFRDQFQPSETISAMYADDILSDGSSIVRIIQGDGGATPTVQLSARAGYDVRCFGVVEQIPAGLVVDQVSDSGTWNPTSRTLRWGPWVDDDPRDVTYRITGPDGIYPMVGAGSFNGLGRLTAGQQELVLQQDATTSRNLVNPWTTNAAMTVSVTPRSGAHCYAVVEYLPVGVRASNISHNGVWSETLNAVKWGPYLDLTPRSFSYDLDGAGQQFSTRCCISVDGVPQWVLNEVQAAAGLPAPIDVSAVPGDQSMGLSWMSSGHEAGIRAVIWTQPGRTDEQTIDIGFGASQPYWISGMQNGERVYAELLAYDAGGGVSLASETVSTVPHDGSGVPGFLYFDGQHYTSIVDRAVITLEDDDLNTSSTALETVNVQVGSTEDSIGFPIVLTETAPDSGVFVSRSVPEERLGLTYAASDAENRLLQVGDGKIFWVHYSDNAPPIECHDTALFGYFDADGDGMWDTFERRHFGSTESHDGTGDEDADGCSDRHESVAGTDPTDPDSHLRIESISVAPGGENLVLRWLNVEGRRYYVESCTSLLSPSFTQEGDSVVGNTETNQVEVLRPDKHQTRFFRINVELEE